MKCTIILRSWGLPLLLLSAFLLIHAALQVTQ